MSVQVDVHYSGLREGAQDAEAMRAKLAELRAQTQQFGSSVDALKAELDAERNSTRSLRAEVDRLRASKREAADATQGAGVAAIRAGQQWGQLGGAIGNVFTIVGQANPQFQQAASIFGQVGAASGALTGALGPLGVAIGAVTTAYGIATIASQDHQRALEAQQDSVDGLARSFDDLESSINAAINAQARQLRLAAGAGSATENLAALQEAQNDQELIQRALAGDSAAIGELRGRGLTGETRAGAGRATGITGLLISAGETLGVVERGSGGPQLSASERRLLGNVFRNRTRRVEEITEDLEGTTAASLQAAETADTNAANPRRGGRGGGAAAQRAALQETSDLGQQILDGLDEEAERRAVIAAEQDEANERQREVREQINALKEFEAELDQRSKQRSAEALAERVEALEKEKAAVEAVNAERRRQTEEITSQAQNQITAIASAYNNAFQQAISGAKSFEESFEEANAHILKMVGDVMLQEGIKQIFLGFADIVANPPNAAIKIPIGFGMVAAGIGLGAAGASIPSKPSEPAEEPRADADVGGGGEGQTLVLNINNPQMAAQTQAQLSRGLRRTLESDRTVGPRARARRSGF